jgi:dipeptidyl aminopeptidase/acylaminoacyl peptidase
MTIHNVDPGDALEYAEGGIIYVIPYYNPWSWMNRQAVAYTDEIVSVLCEKYGLSDNVKIVSTGGSMGGLSALVYCAYAKITPCACVASCPVCDLPFHFTERPDLPRTLYSAFGEYEGDMQSALRSCSPLHLVEKMPNIPYTIFHCEEDKAVNLEKHSEKFVSVMNEKRKIELKRVHFRGHCDLSDEARLDYKKTILQTVLN